MTSILLKIILLNAMIYLILYSYYQIINTSYVPFLFSQYYRHFYLLFLRILIHPFLLNCFNIFCHLPTLLYFDQIVNCFKYFPLLFA